MHHADQLPPLQRWYHSATWCYQGPCTMLTSSGFHWTVKLWYGSMNAKTKHTHTWTFLIVVCSRPRFIGYAKIMKKTPNVFVLIFQAIYDLAGILSFSTPERTSARPELDSCSSDHRTTPLWSNRQTADRLLSGPAPCLRPLTSVMWPQLMLTLYMMLLKTHFCCLMPCKRTLKT